MTGGFALFIGFLGGFFQFLDDVFVKYSLHHLVIGEFLSWLLLQVFFGGHDNASDKEYEPHGACGPVW